MQVFSARAQEKLAFSFSINPANNLKIVRFIGLYICYTVAINQKERLMAMAMVELRNVRGHIQVYDLNGNFLFSADNEREVREELEYYAESAA